MTQKFGRNFRITIDPKDGGAPIIVTMPFTIRFWIQRSATSDTNPLSLDIYNLSAANRSRLYQDAWNQDTNAIKTIVVEMGYSTLYRVFSGVIHEMNSSREGVDIVTRIEAYDNGSDIATTKTFQTLESGQSIAAILGFLIGQFPNLTQGAIGNFPQIMQRPVTLNGSTWDLLKTYSNNKVYIDNGKIYVLNDNEVVGAQTYTVNSDTGLLETPRRAEGTLSISMLLETGIDLFTQVKLESSINKLYNETYKVIGIRHEGTISGAVNGRAVTTLTLNRPGKFGGFTQVTGQ